MSYINNTENNTVLCEPLARYRYQSFKQLGLFSIPTPTKNDDIRVVELFAGVGGFRIGLERASERYKTVWNNQWEPSTKKQDASIIYTRQFGYDGHSNEDINTVDSSQIPDCDLLVGGFPCQDYSVATTLKNSGGIQGKKGVLWWQIYRILDQSNEKPKCLFLENVDRLIKSPASQRGRDFAIILASLSDLGYCVEWKIINAADYGMPQRRRRTYILAYKEDSKTAKQIADNQQDWLLTKGVMAQTFKSIRKNSITSNFIINGDLAEITKNFNSDKKDSPFFNTGVMYKRQVLSFDTVAQYDGPRISLGDIILDEKDVPEEFFVDEVTLEKWKYFKGSKSEIRTSPEGFSYKYSEGAMTFPDALDAPSRTIITGEGGAGPSRFKHIIKTASGRYRRLVPIELERLNMFPDNHTQGATDLRRAFLMGNALVTGIVDRIGVSLISKGVL